MTVSTDMNEAIDLMTTRDLAALIKRELRGMSAVKLAQAYVHVFSHQLQHSLDSAGEHTSSNALVCPHH
jgi:hypothetical protein